MSDIKVRPYSNTFTATRAELDEARRTAYPMQGVRCMSMTRAQWVLRDNAEREIAAHLRARAEYPAKLAEWQANRKVRVDAIERNITLGMKYTHDGLKRLVDEIWSTKPVDPDAEPTP